jgi:Na+-driven multidrug efflux pump
MLVMAGVVALVTTPVLWFGSSQFLLLLTDKLYLVPIGAGYVSMMAIGQPAQTIAPVLNGVLRAANHKKTPMISTASGIWLVRVPIIILTAFVFHGSIYVVWFAIAIDQVFRLAISTAFFLRFKVQNAALLGKASGG